MAFDQFVSWNPGGFGSVSKAVQNKKLSIIKNYLLHPEKLNMLCLVETHLFEKNKLPKYLIDFEHTYHICHTFASVTDTHAGITVFINKKYQLLHEEILMEGRLLYVQVKNISDTTQNFFFYYGPHSNLEERERHIDIAQNYINNNTLEEIFFLGEFNYVTSNLDTNQGSINYQTLAQSWIVFEQNNSIFDTFRYRCPKRRLYSNTGTNKKSKTRIDRIYVPSTIIDQIKSTLFHETEKIRHKIVEVQVFKGIENGPGSWAFKNSLLQDEGYTDLITKEMKFYQTHKGEYNNKTQF